VPTISVPKEKVGDGDSSDEGSYDDGKASGPRDNTKTTPAPKGKRAPPAFKKMSTQDRDKPRSIAVPPKAAMKRNTRSGGPVDDIGIDDTEGRKDAVEKKRAKEAQGQQEKKLKRKAVDADLGEEEAPVEVADDTESSDGESSDGEDRGCGDTWVRSSASKAKPAKKVKKRESVPRPVCAKAFQEHEKDKSQGKSRGGDGKRPTLKKRKGGRK
jgi:hypothetical protein